MKFIYALVFPLFLLLAVSPARAEDDEHTLKYDGYRREYLVHTPPGYSRERKLPVILNFHGGGGSIEVAEEDTKMSETADKHGFIVVYPEGIGWWKFHVWNGGNCCGKAVDKNVDDVGFISSLIGVLARDYNIDTKRVYATGISNGAQISYRLACELSDKITAIAPVASQPVLDFSQCKMSRPVPVLHFHGTEDHCARYEGGENCGGCFTNFFHAFYIPMKEKPWPCESVKKSIDTIKGMYGCSRESVVTYHHGQVTCESAKGCMQGANVTLCTIKGGGHTWPDAGVPKMCRRWPDGSLCRNYFEQVGSTTHDINANEAMWAFFQRYSL